MRKQKVILIALLSQLACCNILFSQTKGRYTESYFAGMDHARNDLKTSIAYYTPLRETNKYKYYLPILEKKLKQSGIIFWPQEPCFDPHTCGDEDEPESLSYYKGYKSIMDSAIISRYGINFIKNIHKQCLIEYKGMLKDSTHIPRDYCYSLNDYFGKYLLGDIEDTIYKILNTDSIPGIIFGPEVSFFTTLQLDLEVQSDGLITKLNINSKYIGNDFSENTISEIKTFVVERIENKLTIAQCQIAKRRFATTISNVKIKVALKSRQK